MKNDLEFRKVKDITKDNLDKYYFYSMTLDSLVRNCIHENASAISTGYLIRDFKI